MSFMHFGTINSTSDNNNVTLSGGYVFAYGFKSTFAGFIWTSTGTVFSTSNGILTQLHSGSDWIIPNGSASGDYFVRWHSLSQTSGDALLRGGSITVNTWTGLDLTREVTFRLLDPEFYIFDDEIDFTAEIRYLDGTNLSYNTETSSFDASRIMASAGYSLTLTTG